MKHLFLINPAAGKKDSTAYCTEQIKDLCRDLDHQILVSEKPGDLTRFAREAAQTGEELRLYACGGDGTLNEVITGLLLGGHKTPLGYIPCGSTNDFAAGLGLPSAPLKACESIVSGSGQMLDVGLFGRDRYFSYTASFGAFTGVSWSTPQNVKNILGHAAYILEGIRSLSDIRPIHMKITADGITCEDDYIFGAVCNSTSLGGVLKLENSEVHMSDGRFEALFIPFPPDLIALNRILSSLRMRHYDDASLHFLRASAFTFDGPSGLSWTLDGEEAEGSGRVEIRNIHNAVTIVCSQKGG